MHPHSSDIGGGSGLSTCEDILTRSRGTFGNGSRTSGNGEKFGIERYRIFAIASTPGRKKEGRILNRSRIHTEIRQHGSARWLGLVELRCLLMCRDDQVLG